MAHAQSVRLIFPHQLFLDQLTASKNTLMILIEDDLFFKQYLFHKQKLVLHRAAMRSFADTLRSKGFKVVYVETSAGHSMNVLKDELKKRSVESCSYYDLVDDWLQQRVDNLMKSLGFRAKRLSSPGFLTSLGQIEDYFEDNSNRMQHFYEWQRKRLNILMDDAKPVGGKWSFDTANRKKLPKNITVPSAYKLGKTTHVTEAITWVNENMSQNPGEAESFSYPVTHEQAEKLLTQFISERLVLFGPYEDAVAQNESQLFHSVLSSSLNCGLLTPQQVIDQVLRYAQNHEVPIESLEGFIRQIIGWREYMRAMYVRHGRKMRTSNVLGFDRSLDRSWWNGTVGIEPIDTTIKRSLNTAYAHHIERLMILGNSMVLLRINPDDVYEWFMSMYIDAYDWVMVPNVYAMSQFAAGNMITTKPYISGSNYILKMSDYSKGDWSEVWDALYWQFIDDHRATIEKNFRTNMMVKLYDGFTADKKKRISDTATPWLN